MRKELLDRANRAIAAATKAGASGVWASASRSRSREFRYRDGNLERAAESTSRGLAIDFYLDGKYSSHSTTDLRPASIDAFVANALAMTRALQPDPHRAMPDPALFAGRPDEAALELVDGAVTELEGDKCIAWCKEMDEATAGDARRITATAYCQTGHSVSAMASSNGFSGSRESTSIGHYNEITFADGDKRPQEGFGVGVRHLEDIMPAREIAERALAKGVSRLGESKGSTARTMMLVDRMATRRMIGWLLSAAYGRSVQQKQSFWAERLGKLVVSPKLTITDDPLIPRGLGSRNYDGEGIAAKTLPIIEAGVFANIYVGNYYAKKLGVAPTATGSSNRIITPGARDFAAILADTRAGVYVTDWLGGNINPTSGDFSYGVRGAEIKGGQLGRRVSEMLITGNIIELFSRLVEIGNDPWMYSSTRSPTMLFEDVQFSGV